MLLRSLYGELSGYYVALTGDPRSEPILIEVIRCRQVKNRLSGSIEGVAVVDINGVTLSNKNSDDFREYQAIIKNEGRYRFNGSIEGRQLVISYNTVLPRVQSIGVITIHADDSGKTFSGQWAGSLKGEVANAPCFWLRLDKAYKKSDYDSFSTFSIRLIRDILWELNDGVPSTKASGLGENLPIMKNKIRGIWMGVAHKQSVGGNHDLFTRKLLHLIKSKSI